jgi:hypothetical protein
MKIASPITFLLFRHLADLFAAIPRARSFSAGEVSVAGRLS